MRTKTLLLAAAALAAGALTTMAQSNVYSLNIVGYVTVAPGNGNYTMMAAPVDDGTNTLISRFPTAPGGTSINLWNNSGFDLYTYQALSKAWKQGTTVANDTPLPVGVGFFISPAGTAPFTNTFVGQVAVLSGQTGTNSILPGVQAVGSLIPYGDYVTNTATLNLIVPGGTILQKWNVANQSFDSYTYQALSKTWKQGTVASTPQIGVGEGFFINTTAGLNWVETAP